MEKDNVRKGRKSIRVAGQGEGCVVNLLECSRKSLAEEVTFKKRPLKDQGRQASHEPSWMMGFRGEKMREKNYRGEFTFGKACRKANNIETLKPQKTITHQQEEESRAGSRDNEYHSGAAKLS